MQLIKLIRSLFSERKAGDIHCPVCGYYCLGKGGMFCIDKPFIVEHQLPVDVAKILQENLWDLYE